MATIRKRGDKFQVRVQLQGFDPVAKSFTTRRDAEAWGKVTESEMLRGVFIKRTDTERTPTLRALVERYRDEVTPSKRGASQEGYLLGAILRPESVAQPMLDLLVTEISPADVARWRDARLKQVKPATLAREWATLGHVLAHGAREWSIPLPNGNPFRQARKPQVMNAKDRRVSDAEIDAITVATESAHLAGLVRLAVETGARRGELLALTWSNIDLKRRTARLPSGTTKNGHARVLPLSPRALAVLEAMPRRLDGKLFDLRADSVTQAFSRAVAHAKRDYKGEDAGFLEGVTFHCLRHEALSRLAEQGWGATEIAAVSGHRTLQLVQRYVHHRPEDLARKMAGQSA